jgi:hypothetical protein
LKLDVEYRVLTCPGEEVSGDAVAVRRISGGYFMAIADGLGHGPHAARAAQAATACVHEAEPDASVEALMRSIDAALSGTRGAAVLLLVIRGAILQGATVGNVELRIAPKGLPIVPTPGIAGRGIRNLRVFEGPLRPGMRFVAFSDGISGSFSMQSYVSLGPAETCAQIAAAYRRPNDDATILVAQVE